MAEPIDLAAVVAEALMQTVSYKLGDVVNQYPASLQPFVMVVFRSLHDAIVGGFSDDERKLYESLIRRTVMMTLPKSMDPREKEDEDDE